MAMKPSTLKPKCNKTTPRVKTGNKKIPTKTKMIKSVLIVYVFSGLTK